MRKKKPPIAARHNCSQSAVRRTKAAVGFEPTNNGFAIRRRVSQTPNKQSNSEHDADSWASGWASLVEKHPELAALVTAWPKLPAAVRAGIIAMIHASG
jgi:hypothetical protein